MYQCECRASDNAAVLLDFAQEFKNGPIGRLRKGRRYYILLARPNFCAKPLLDIN
jgi:hypothetical protein